MNIKHNKYNSFIPDQQVAVVQRRGKLVLVLQSLKLRPKIEIGIEDYGTKKDNVQIEKCGLVKCS